MLGRWECRLGERGRGRLRGVTEVAAGGKGFEDLRVGNVGIWVGWGIGEGEGKAGGEGRGEWRGRGRGGQGCRV